MAALNAVVLLLAAAPFVVWEGLGPERFDRDLRLPARNVPVVGTDSTAPVAGSWVEALDWDLSPSTTITLVFSVGSRNVDRTTAERLRVHDVEDRGGDGLTDTMMLVVADRATGDVALLSLPRDLWVFERGHRINATLNRHGLQAFVDDVSHVTGLPIHHLVQLNFAAFADLVDAVGGVALSVNRPLADIPAVLYVPEPGCWRFDGAAALAWVRSRTTLTQDSAGDWVVDRSASDFGRIARQQQLLGALWDQVRSPSAIGALPDLIGAARRGLVVDEGLGLQQVRDLLAAFSDVAAGRMEGHTMPTVGRRIGRAAAQVVDEDAAAAVLTRLRTWPPEDAATGTGPPGTTVGRSDTPTILAAAADSTLPVDPTCTLETAQALPDPRPPLGGIAAQRGDAGDDGPASGPDERPTGEAPGGPDGSESPTPSEPGPTEPTPTETETDDGLLPPLWPG